MKRSDIKRLKIYSIMLLIAAPLSFIYMKNNPMPPPDKSTESQSSDFSSAAWVIAQDFLERYLKAPSSAKYPSYNREFVERQGNTYYVKAYVDAQNSFGAMLRQQFAARLEYKGNKKWHCVYLTLDGDPLIQSQF